MAMEIEEAHQRSGVINKESVRDGLYLGLINVAISLIGWLFDPLFFFKHTASGFILAAVFLGLQCLFLVQIRRTLGNFWSFGEALRASIIIALISTAVYTLWQALLFNVLDPTLGARAQQAILDMVAETFEKMGGGGNADAAIEKMKSQDMNPGHMGNILKGLLYGVGFWAVLSVILALIFQRKKPMFKA